MNPESQGGSATSSRSPWRWVWPLVVLLAVFVFLGWPTKTTPSNSYDYSTFVTKVDQGQVASVTIASDGGLTGKLKDGMNFSSRTPTGVGETGLVPLLQQHQVTIKATTPKTSIWAVLLSWVPWLVIFGVLIWFWRRSARELAGAGRIGGIGRSHARIIEAERPQTTFADVAGYAEVKQEIAEVVEFLANPGRYRLLGAVLPKGILLVGPPGTGKTLLARAVAGEAGVPFLSVTASSFMEIFVGVGASRVRDLFREARERAPAIVFIDEIDAIGGRRGAGILGHEERGQTLDQLLAEMDGFDPSAGVVVLAATNRPDVLDPALLRPGRFDLQVVVPLPDREERLAILQVHTRGKPLESDVDLDVVARGTPGFSGADLANLVNEAAIFAVRRNRTHISSADLADARDRVLLGLRKSASALLPAERRAVAVHEAGHALVAALCPHADPIAKITILPAGQALGATEQLPVDERHLYPQGYLDDLLAIRLGGRAAEQLVFGEPSTGAADDLNVATEIALRMVRNYGMSSTVGPVGYGAPAGEFLGLETPAPRPYAEATQRVMDREVAALLHAAEQRARELLAEHLDALHDIADVLVEEETVNGSRVYELLGVPPREADTSKPAPATPPRQRADADGRRNLDTTSPPRGTLP